MYYTLAIPEPCHEDWNKMTATERGKFCDSCQKQVFDLSVLSDYEIAKTLERGKSLCGRLKKSQLNRPIHGTIPSKKNNLKIATGITASILGIAPSVAHAQGEIMPENYQTEQLSPFEEGDLTHGQSIHIKGTVTNTAGETLSGVTIKLKNTQVNYTTDQNGMYEVSFDYVGFREHPVVRFLYEGFDSIELAITASDTVVHVTLEDQGSASINSSIQLQINDENGVPFPGVNVLVIDTANGSQTDFDGLVSLDGLSIGKKLLLSYIGYKDLIIEITEKMIEARNVTAYSLKPDSNFNNYNIIAGQLTITSHKGNASASSYNKLTPNGHGGFNIRY